MKSGRTADDLYIYKGIIKRVIDGDTIIIDIDLGFKFRFCEQPIRLYGINAPEIEDSEGLRAKEFLGQYENCECRIKTVKDKKGKYGRFLAVVWIFINNRFVNINELLVEKGYAVYYDARHTGDEIKRTVQRT